MAYATFNIEESRAIKVNSKNFDIHIRVEIIAQKNSTPSRGGVVEIRSGKDDHVIWNAQISEFIELVDLCQYAIGKAGLKHTDNER